MNTPNESEHRFAVCIRNDDYEASLEMRKIYQVIHDADAASHHLLRVIDESGDDYLYPDEFFMLVELSEAVRKALMRAA